jgi:N-acetylmuramate 1-kinase
MAGICGEILEEMPPGASTRRFFRVALGPGRTAVAMYAPGTMGGPSAARQAVGHASFLSAQALLASWGLPVPAVHAYVPEHEVLFVEDLGADTLAQYLTRRPQSAADLYTKAVGLLAHAQAKFAAEPAAVVTQRAFDYDLLRFEVDHFLDWALLARNVPVSAAGRTAFETAAHYLASAVADLPRGFVHRDYQSKNLMVRETTEGATLTWIDFQDAMLGPRAYDLVALLMDSYQTFDNAFVRNRLDDYLRAAGRSDTTALSEEFDLITVQRKLKDAGRFVYLERERNNPSFLGYVDGAIDRATAALDRIHRGVPVLERLADFLADVLPPRR